MPLTLSHRIIATITIVTIVYDTVLPASAISEFAPYADTLAGSGIINKSESEAWYRLGDSVTRAETAKIAVKLSGSGTTGCRGNVYSDVASSSGDLCEYIEAAADAKIVSGAYGRFRPSDAVTRAELMKMLLGAVHIAPSGTPSGFADVPAGLWDLAGYVNAGVEAGCIKPGPLFSPSTPAARWEVFKIAACVFKNRPLPTSYSPHNLVWSDEFSGSSLDPAKWNIETWADGWGNNELQNYTESWNISVSDGNLIIEAKKENSPASAQYSSARINTHQKASWTYGRIEARIKLPSGQWMWPAFWMLGENIDTVGYPRCGEMDIVEMVGGKSADDGTANETTIWGSIHRPDNDPNKKDEVKSVTSSFINPAYTGFSNDFHIYSIEWNEKTIKHSVDGQVYRTTDISSKTDGFEVFHKPFYIILNVAVGGTWPGSPDQTTVWPQRMLVDWVRVYQ